MTARTLAEILTTADDRLWAAEILAESAAAEGRGHHRETGPDTGRRHRRGPDLTEDRADRRGLPLGHHRGPIPPLAWSNAACYSINAEVLAGMRNIITVRLRTGMAG
ncbi:hypothetical protein [Candidatus Poriferisocius sp.]|uniref:hypothetical protein n=1 Tax=Candidatus Poriferisocius sp. TaxID=3101276 RepID=UPI003B0256E5